MPLDFSTMQTEFFSRGFEYLNDAGSGLAKAKRWINQAMHEIDGEHEWPFLEATSTGSAPLTISDLGRVDTIYDVTNDRPLVLWARRALVDAYGNDLDKTGSAVAAYLTANSVVRVYPVQAVSLSVRYWKVGPDLSADDDEPLMPDRFRMSIVNLAVANGHRENGNNAQAADAQAEAQRLVSKMADELLDEGLAFVAGDGVDW